jgi:DNA repair exonuclease SbcCD ATPase subunit
MPADPAKAAALQTAQVAQKKKEIQDQIKQKQEELRALQQQLSNPMIAVAENQRSLRRRLKESEVQQAQVVLASQDMVDQVQKMSEQVSAMQFKDLPALVDQIKNEVGVDQASQFNGDANAALAGLLQNLQGAKQALEAALGVVTGQAPQVPGAELAGAEVGADLEAGDELGADDELDALAADAEEEMDSTGAPAASLGRGRR